MRAELDQGAILEASALAECWRSYEYQRWESASREEWGYEGRTRTRDRKTKETRASLQAAAT